MTSIARVLFGEGALASPEAPEDAVFGQYLFAPERRRMQNTAFEIPFEENTKLEKDLFWALKDYFDDNSWESLEPYTKALKGVLAKKQYTLILDPGSKPVYRMLVMPVDKFKQITGVELVEGGWRVEAVNKPGKLKAPKGRKIQGWTARPDVAFKPGNSSIYEIGDVNSPELVTVVFIANPTDSGNVFFGRPGILAKIASPGLAWEAETISIGTVSFSSFVYGWIGNTAINVGRDSWFVEEIIRRLV